MTILSEQQSAQPNWRWLINPIHCLSLGLGCGLSPLAPGTVGTLLGVAIYLLIMDVGVLFYLSIVLVIIGIATAVAEYTSEALGGVDHRAIVIDEIAGFLIACISLPADWIYLLLAFVLFRIFDIAKPWPIDFIDRRIGGGVGIIGDDLMAGLYTLLCIQLLALIISVVNIYLAT